MKTYNYLFSSQQRLKYFLQKNDIDPTREYFIQVFMGDNNPNNLQSALDSISQTLPFSSIIATSTAGEIIEGGMVDNSTVISITEFNSTKVNVALIEGDSEEDIANKIATTMIHSNTKLLIAFNNVYAKDGEVLLREIEKKAPNIVIAGGNAGDNGGFAFSTTVGVNNSVSTTGVAIATFDSDVLQVFNDFLFNWQTIGEAMVVTKADKSTIYEINNEKAQSIYRDFLGDEVADSLPSSAVEFPLIFNEDGIEIARAPVAIGNNGELIMAGHIKENTIVKFGFGDVSQNDINIADSIRTFSKNPVESIFIYSCSARKYFLQGHLNNEFEMLQKIAPTSGFITYGEFFQHNKCNKMLNVSSTFLGLSEDVSRIHKIDFKPKDATNSSRTLHALTHLVKQSAKRVEEKNNNLTQFQNLIKASTIYSTTDTKGIITDVNKQFEQLSGYSREELIGKNHNIVRHEDMPSATYSIMWDTIKAKQSWKGIIKNKAKDGSAYYVRSNVFPILDAQGKIVQYLSIRDNITEEVQRREYLKGSINTLEEKTNEKEYLINQYEKVINLSSAFFRMDSKLNLIHVNDVFCDIFDSSSKELINKNLYDLLEPEFTKTQAKLIYTSLLENETWSGTIPFNRLDGTIIYMDTVANTIYDKNSVLSEIMLVMHDVTDLIVAQKEIEETQKDVVFTMGAIGETRSKETGNHVRRVAEYSRLLAIHSGLSEQRAELLKMASPMHDIGKVGIPDAILNKPGKLTDEEWIIMKTHSALGYQMLKNSKRTILKTAAIVAYTHHEKWDGSGYPKGMKGEEIHIFGRITAIADVFDALGSDRCYKKAWPEEKVLELIRNESGKHFDPALVEIFFENLDSFYAIRDEFKD